MRGVFAHSNPSSGAVTEGTSFSINCSADASISPTPVIDLLHMGSVSNSTMGYELIYVVGSASKADQGNYECFVQNRQGNTTKSLPNSISVLSKRRRIFDLLLFGLMRSFYFSTSQCGQIYNDHQRS